VDEVFCTFYPISHGIEIQSFSQVYSLHSLILSFLSQLVPLKSVPCTNSPLKPVSQMNASPDNRSVKYLSEIGFVLFLN